MTDGVARERLIGSAITGVAPVPRTGAVSGSMGADIVGAPINVAGKKFLNLEFAWDGGTGQCSAEWSNEYDPTSNPNATFTTYTLSAADAALVAPAGTAGRGAVAIEIGGETWVRPRYTRTGGTGNMTCTAGLR